MKNPKEVNQFEKQAELIKNPKLSDQKTNVKLNQPIAKTDPDNNHQSNQKIESHNDASLIKNQKEQQLNYWDYCHSLRETIQASLHNEGNYSIFGMGISASSCTLECMLEILPINEQGCVSEKNLKILSLKEIRQGFSVTPANHVKTDKGKKVYYKFVAADPMVLEKYDSNNHISDRFPIQKDAPQGVQTGIEYLINTIAYLLDGKAAKTTLLMLSGNFANALKNQGYEYKGHVDYFVQASEAVGKYKLLDYYQAHFKNFSKIAIANYSTHFTLSLCTCPFDAKFDNFQTDEIALSTIDITSIDSDVSCVKPYEVRSRENNTKIHRMNIRSGFFLLPQLNDAYALIEKISSDSVELQLLKILKSVCTFQRQFIEDMLPPVQKQQAKNLLEYAGLPLMLPGWFIDYFYETLCKIKFIVTKNPRASHAQILREIHPLIYYYYEEAKKTWIALDWLLDLAFPEDVENKDSFQLKEKLPKDLSIKIDELLPNLRAKIQKIYKNSDALHIRCIKGLHDLPPLLKLLKPIVWNYYEINKIPINLVAVYKEYIQSYQTTYLSIEEMLGGLLNEKLPLPQKELDDELKKIDTFLENAEKQREISVESVIQNFISKIKLEQLTTDEQLKLVKELLWFYQTDPHLFPNGLTPLHLAIEASAVVAADWLTHQGLVINIQDARTALNKIFRDIQEKSARRDLNEMLGYLIEKYGIYNCENPLAVICNYEHYRLNNPPKGYLGSIDELKTAIRLLPIYQYPDKDTGKRPITEIEDQEWKSMLMSMMVPFDNNNVASATWVVYGNVPDDNEKVELKKFILNQEIIEQLSKNIQFNESLNKKRNRVSVHIKGKHYDTYIKIYPQAPGREIAAYQFCQLFSGQGITPSTLFKLCVCNDKGAIIKSAPILISKTVRGKTLEKVLSESNWQEILKVLHAQCFTLLIIIAAHTKFGDGGGRNLGVEEFHDLDNKKWTRIMGFDNDHNHVPLFTVKINQQVTNIQYLPFCFDQMLSNVNYNHLQAYYAIDIRKSFSLLLQKFAEYQQIYINNCFSYKEIEDYQRPLEQYIPIGETSPTTQLSLLMDEVFIGELCLEVQHLRNQLEIYKLQNEEIDHLDIVGEISFLLAKLHREVINNVKTHDPQKRLVLIIGKKLSATSKTVTTRNAPKANNIVSKSVIPISGLILSEFKAKTTILDITKCEKLLDQIYNKYGDMIKEIQITPLGNTFNTIIERFQNLSYACQELIINSALPVLTQDKTVDSTSKQGMLLDAMGGGSYRRLHLSHSPAVTNERLQKILQNSYEIVELNFNGCHQLQQNINTITTIGDIIEKHGQLLKKLSLSNISIEAFASILGNPLVFPMLKQLSLNECIELKTVKITAPQLRILRVTDCAQLKMLTTTSKQLTELYLKGCPEFTDSALTKIADNMKQLKNIDLTNCYKISHGSFWQTYPFLIEFADQELPIEALKNLLLQFRLDNNSKIKIQQNIQQWLEDRDYTIDILFTAMKKEKDQQVKNTITKSLNQSQVSNPEIYKTLLKMLRESEQCFWQIAAKVYDCEERKFKGSICDHFLHTLISSGSASKKQQATDVFSKMCKKNIGFIEFKTFSKLLKEIDNNLIIARTLNRLGYTQRPFFISMCLNLYEVGKIYSQMLAKMDDDLYFRRGAIKSICDEQLKLAENKMEEILNGEADGFYVKNMRRTIKTLSLFGLYFLYINLNKFPEYNYNLLTHTADEDPQTREIQKDYSKLLISLSQIFHPNISDELYADVIAGFLSEDPTLVLEKLRQLKPPKLIAALWDKFNKADTDKQYEQIVSLAALAYLEQITSESILSILKDFNADYIRASYQKIHMVDLGALMYLNNDKLTFINNVKKVSRNIFNDVMIIQQLINESELKLYDPKSIDLICWRGIKSSTYALRKLEKIWGSLVQVFPVAIEFMLTGAKANDITHKNSIIYRIVAAYALGKVKIPSKEVVNTLIELSKESDVLICINAILSLQTMNQSIPEETISSLINSLSRIFKFPFSSRTADDKGVDVWYYACSHIIKRLGRFKYGTKQIIDLLLEILKTLQTFPKHPPQTLLNAIRVTLHKLGCNLSDEILYQTVGGSIKARGQLRLSKELLTFLMIVLNNPDTSQRSDAAFAMGQLLQPTSLENFLRKNLHQQLSSEDSLDVNPKNQKEPQNISIISDKLRSFLYNDNNLERDKESLNVLIQRKNSESTWNKTRLIFQKAWDVKPYPLITDIPLVGIIFNDRDVASAFGNAIPNLYSYDFFKGYRLEIHEDENKQFWTVYIPEDIYNKLKNNTEAYAKFTDGETRITDRINQKAESPKTSSTNISSNHNSSEDDDQDEFGSLHHRKT